MRLRDGSIDDCPWPEEQPVRKRYKGELFIDGADMMGGISSMNARSLELLWLPVSFFKSSQDAVESQGKRAECNTLHQGDEYPVKTCETFNA